MINVLEYLENSAKLYPEKVAVRDADSECTYGELLLFARQIGTFLAGGGAGTGRNGNCGGSGGGNGAGRNCGGGSGRSGGSGSGRSGGSGIVGRGEPVAVFAPKGVETLQAFLGVVYAGGFYVPVDPELPAQRIRSIFEVLKPRAVISREEYGAKLEESGCDAPVFTVDEMRGEVDGELLADIRRRSLDVDPLYAVFTSGSTGTPKGVLICHRSVIDFIDNFTGIFGITEADVIGNQAPFDFDVSVKDIYSALKTGATLVIIPREFFIFPMKIMDMIDENRVTTLIWAVSALCMLNRLHGLKYKAPQSINKIMFSGEMMPVKQLNAWRKFYPDAVFVNLYGPTEITCNCTYFVVDREFSEDERLPIGNAFPNEKVFLLDGDGAQVTESGVTGEICVGGTALALGYYNAPERTAEAFVRNPLNPYFPEIIYRTGDLAYYDGCGRLVFAGRKDFQIKHMGHRIELEEVDSAMNSLKEVENACAFFDEAANKIVAYYVGSDDRGGIIDEMKMKVPEFMIPNVWVRVDEIPLTKNGKIDRGYIRDLYRAGKN